MTLTIEPIETLFWHDGPQVLLGRDRARAAYLGVRVNEPAGVHRSILSSRSPGGR